MIPVRDRLACLRQLVAWLERAGVDEITLLDNDSAYPPLLEWLDSSPHEVIRLGWNAGPHAPWITGLVEERFADRSYVVSDPDIVPDETCPLDLFDHLADVLARHDVAKVGIGLRNDDIPLRYAHRDTLLALGRRVQREVAPGLFATPVDTTLALYRAGAGRGIHNALRTGPPYLARHLSWYEDSENPDPELQFYRRRASPRFSHWDRKRLPLRLREEAWLYAPGNHPVRARIVSTRRRLHRYVWPLLGRGVRLARRLRGRSGSADQ